jgi:hypothetical protein
MEPYTVGASGFQLNQAGACASSIPRPHTLSKSLSSLSSLPHSSPFYDFFLSCPAHRQQSLTASPQVSFNATLDTWDIDVAFSKPSSYTVLALYLPRAETNPDGSYSARFNSTFYPGGFPCSVADTTARAATTCCLADFRSLYHVVTSSALPTNGTCAPPYANSPPLLFGDAIVGGFGSDMPASSAALLTTPAGWAVDVQLVRLTVASQDLRTVASKLDGQARISESLDAFVGLAQVSAVPGSRILDSAAMQVRDCSGRRGQH